MGRSQRALRGPARYGTRRENTDDYGMDSRGETYYPSEAGGYEYNWGLTWPSGSGGQIEAPGGLTLTVGPPTLPSNNTQLTFGWGPADADARLFVFLDSTPAGGPIQDIVIVDVSNGDGIVELANALHAAMDALDGYIVDPVAGSTVPISLQAAGTIDRILYGWYPPAAMRATGPLLTPADAEPEPEKPKKRAKKKSSE